MSAHDGTNSASSGSRLVKPERLCAVEASLEGETTILGMSRLLPMLANDSGDASYRLNFRYSRNKKMQIFGEVKAQLSVTCQRCSQATQLELSTTPQIQLVGSEAEAKLVDDEFDPVLAPENGLSIADLLEEELIVAMPLIPKCEHDCSVQTQYGVDEEVVETEPQEEKRENPFDILAQLKRDK